MTAGSRDQNSEQRGSWNSGIKRLVRGSRQKHTLALDKGRRRLFEHMRDQGEQVETLWESAKTTRHLTREEGQVT